MALYPKKLRGIEDLHREQQLLMKESRRLDKDEFLSVDGLMGKGAKADGISDTLLDMLPISNPIVSRAVKMIVARLMKKDRAPKQAPMADDNGRKKESLLKKAAIEFIGGYLKWKAIELSYKGIKYLINKRKEY